MSDPFIGECRLVAFNFPPNGWLMCAGQTLSISDNSALFQLIGTTYGGDGQQTFQMPDLQGRVPLHQGSFQGTPFTIGQRGGVETVTLTSQQMPIHNHPLNASNVGGNSNFPQNNTLAPAATQVYVTGPSPIRAMNQSAAITPSGGSQPHDNLQPYLTMTWVISLYGVFPSQN
jgi:microcystin-dependent protein